MTVSLMTFPINTGLPAQVKPPSVTAPSPFSSLSREEPYVKEIDSGLESLQHEVGGCIEAIYPYEDPVALVCNEEGKLEGLPLNRALRDEDGDIYDVVAGTFMVVGLTDDSFGSLTVEQMQKFSDLFKVPEQFVKLGDKIVRSHDLEGSGRRR